MEPYLNGILVMNHFHIPSHPINHTQCSPLLDKVAAIGARYACIGSSQRSVGVCVCNSTAGSSTVPYLCRQQAVNRNN